MRIGERFQFCPFWKLTRWGLLLNTMFGRPLWLNEGCDEWHNKSLWMLVPLVGEFVYFPKKGFDRSGEEHVYGQSPEGIHGRVVPGCGTCQEILDIFEEED